MRRGGSAAVCSSTFAFAGAADNGRWLVHSTTSSSPCIELGAAMRDCCCCSSNERSLGPGIIIMDVREMPSGRM